MADVTGYDRGEIVPTTGAGIPKNYHDNGDGTYSEQTYSGGGTLPTGAATSAKQDTQTTALNTISSKLTGAASVNVGQATAGVASGALVIARATRRSVLIRNTDAANSVYIGTGTVTSSHFLLKAGESVSVTHVGAINCIRATADVVLAFWDEFD